MAKLSSCVGKRESPRCPGRLLLDDWETPGVIQGGLLAEMNESGLRVHSIHKIQIGAELRTRVYVSKDEYRFDCIEGRGQIMWTTLPVTFPF